MEPGLNPGTPTGDAGILTSILTPSPNCLVFSLYYKLHENRLVLYAVVTGPKTDLP